MNRDMNWQALPAQWDMPKGATQTGASTGEPWEIELTEQEKQRMIDADNKRIAALRTRL